MPTKEAKQQHLVALTVSNFRRLKAFHIEPGPNGVVILTGKNQQGKSSAVSSVCAAFQGERYAPKAPIHRGTERAEIIAQTEDFVVTRTFTAKGTGIVVKDAEGRAYSSPQTLLDKFYNFAGFDLQAFARMTEKDRTAKLLEICPVDIDLAQNKADEKAVYAKRTELGVALKQAEAALKEAPVVEGAPEEEVSVAALSETLAVLQEQDAGLTELMLHARQINEKMAEYEAEVRRIQGLLTTLTNDAITTQGTIRETPVPAEDIAGVRRAIATAEEQNALYRQAEDHDKAVARVDTADKRHTAQERKLEKIRAARADALRRAEFPVETMTLADDGTVMYQGIPFSEASTKEEIEVGTQLAVHANPNLRLGFIREGSALDSDAVQMIDELARENDLLILMEVVESDNPAAIEIVDGCNVEEVQDVD